MNLKKKLTNFYYADIDDGAINTASSMDKRCANGSVSQKGQEVARKVGGVPETNQMRDFWIKENL